MALLRFFLRLCMLLIFLSNPILKLPNSIYTRFDDDSYSAVKLLAGDTACSTLHIQMINSARKLLDTHNVFEFFQIESEEEDSLKAECCFKLKNGQHVVKPGVQTSLSKLIRLLKQKLKQKLESLLNADRKAQGNYVTNEFIGKHPLLKSLIKWYHQNDSADTNGSNELMMLLLICYLT